MSSRWRGELLYRPNGRPSKCIVCGAVPSIWRVELPEPDQSGRRFASFCERHEANKDMLLARLAQPDDLPE